MGAREWTLQKEVKRIRKRPSHVSTTPTNPRRGVCVTLHDPPAIPIEPGWGQDWRRGKLRRQALQTLLKHRVLRPCLLHWFHCTVNESQLWRVSKRKPRRAGRDNMTRVRPVEDLSNSHAPTPSASMCVSRPRSRGLACRSVHLSSVQDHATRPRDAGGRNRQRSVGWAMGCRNRNHTFSSLLSSLCPFFLPTLPALDVGIFRPVRLRYTDPRRSILRGKRGQETIHHRDAQTPRLTASGKRAPSITELTQVLWTLGVSLCDSQNRRYVLHLLPLMCGVPRGTLRTVGVVRRVSLCMSLFPCVHVVEGFAAFCIQRPGGRRTRDNLKTRHQHASLPALPSCFWKQLGPYAGRLGRPRLPEPEPATRAPPASRTESGEEQ